MYIHFPPKCAWALKSATITQLLFDSAMTFSLFVLSPFVPFGKQTEMTLRVICSFILTLAVVAQTSSIAFVTGDEMGTVYTRSLQMYIAVCTFFVFLLLLHSGGKYYYSSLGFLFSPLRDCSAKMQ